MGRCIGRTRTLHRCGRVGPWRFYCRDHRYQPLHLCLTLLAVLGAIASIAAWLRDSPDDARVDCSAPVYLAISNGQINVPRTGCYTVDTDAGQSIAYISRIVCQPGDRFVLKSTADSREVIVTPTQGIGAEFHLNCTEDRLELDCNSQGVAVAGARGNNCGS